MTKTTTPDTVSPDTAPDTAPDNAPDEQPELLVTDHEPTLEERLEFAVALLTEALTELPAGHPDAAAALVHLAAVEQRATAALPIPPADEV